MSCNLYGVGDKCRAKNAITVVRQVQPNQQVSVVIQKDDEGLVLDINPDIHVMVVFWFRLQQSVIMTHSQIHDLDRLP